MSDDSVRTLRTMWGKGASEASSSAPPAPSVPSVSPAPPVSSSTPAPTRKRRKKDPAGAGQARLTVSVNGVGVGPPEKRSRKVTPAKLQDDGSDDIIEIGPPYSIVSPDSSAVASSPPRHDEVVVTGTSGVPRSKGRPKKIVFATDTKAPHAFFARPGKTNMPTASDAVSESANIETPGTSTAVGSGSGSASASASASVAPSGTATPVHSFFAARQSGLRKGWGCCREGEEPTAPWPGGEWPSHVNFGDSQPISSRIAMRPRPLANGVDAVDAVDAVDGFSSSYSLLRPSSPSPSRPTHTRHPNSFPPFILQHPAIQAVKPTNNRETWCEAHRPRTASAVLGNELEATYLRDWLAALSVGSREARRVIRRVPRRKALDPDTSWIVDDTFAEPFTDDAFYDDELPEPEDEPQFPLGGRPDKYPVIDYWIGNALLLTGPSGCGKSAAVYAAADELGWDVFEVYPGIGKRTGAHLLALVGEVGKNHMVGERKENKKDTTKAVAKAFFGVGAAKAASSPSVGGSASDPIELEETPIKEKPDHSLEKEVKTKQSLILIDEADILFDEESTFWPAVVSLIAESRRPVVITCNDLARIPRDSLPIHTTLYFLPPPSYLAQPYLAAIASAHGVEADAADLYAHCTRVPVNLVDQPLPPSGHEPAALFDLRAAINELQLDRGVKKESDKPRSVESGDLANMARALDAVSLVDAQIGPRPWERMEMCEIDRLAPTADDEEGIHQLLKPDVQHRHPALAAYAHSSDMAGTLVSAVGGHLELSDKATELNMAQTAYSRHILPALDEVVTLAGRLLPHPTLYMETMPFLRILVHTDDILEAADRAAVAAGTARVNRQGRAVRGTARAYERHLVMEERALAVAREEVLAWSG